MPRFRAWFCRLFGLVRKRSRESEMKAKIQQHLEALTERNIGAGMSPKEVRNVSVRVSLSRPSGLIANSRTVVLDQGFHPWCADKRPRTGRSRTAGASCKQKGIARSQSTFFKNYFGSRPII